MKETRGESWEDFERWLQDRRDERQALSEFDGMSSVSTLLFRGQPNLPLRTTLERYGASLKVWDYYSAVNEIKSSIESLTGQRWDTSTEGDFAHHLEGNAKLSPLPMSDYEFWAHLRHHGFPSPLLDWTRSPYVAAFFAFQEMKQDQSDRVAIFAYLEDTGGGKLWDDGMATIRGVGPSVTTHKRHVLQQAEYTICSKTVDGVRFYAPHEEAMEMWDLAADQDALWKLTLPISIRLDVLRKFEEFNLNAFSLFQTEDSLMHTMALRAFFFGR